MFTNEYTLNFSPLPWGQWLVGYLLIHVLVVYQFLFLCSSHCTSVHKVFDLHRVFISVNRYTYFLGEEYSVNIIIDPFTTLTMRPPQWTYIVLKTLLVLFSYIIMFNKFFFFYCERTDFHWFWVYPCQCPLPLWLLDWE